MKKGVKADMEALRKDVKVDMETLRRLKRISKA